MKMDSFTKDFAILLIGVICGVLPWLLDKAGLEMPRLLSVILVYASIGILWWAFSSLDWLDAIPYLHSRQMSASKTVLCCLAIMAVFLWTAKSFPAAQKEPEVVSAANRPTFLRLQFGASEDTPTSIGQNNIGRWYALHAISEGVDLKTSQMAKGAEMWTIFVTFDSPVAFREMRVDGYDLPRNEVKDSSTKTAIVVLSGKMDGKVLTIHAAS